MSTESETLNDLVPTRLEGHYADKHKRASYLRWSHGARFVKARQIIEPMAGGKLLDYGCGDGTFISQVVELFPDATGVDKAEEQVIDCRSRLGKATSQSFYTCEDLKGDAWGNKFDVATCMEVLEHCRDVVVDRVLDDLRRLVRPNGTIVISVPIETGPTLAIKQMLRRFAGWKGISGYQYTERYGTSEFWRMLFATRNSKFHRPVYAADDASDDSGYHGHKGFNWRRLQAVVSRKMILERVAFTPLPYARSILNSQVWFVCRTRY